MYVYIKDHDDDEDHDETRDLKAGFYIKIFSPKSINYTHVSKSLEKEKIKTTSVI